MRSVRYGVIRFVTNSPATARTGKINRINIYIYTYCQHYWNEVLINLKFDYYYYLIEYVAVSLMLKYKVESL